MAKNSQLLILAIAMLVSTGCQWGGFTKRAQELCCPTDVRQMHWWCWGEDAIFDTPCGPDEAYHGHKPTCWNAWPAPTTAWRDEHCGPPTAGCLTGDCPAVPSAEGMHAERVIRPVPFEQVHEPLKPTAVEDLPSPERAPPTVLELPPQAQSKRPRQPVLQTSAFTSRRLPEPAKPSRASQGSGSTYDFLIHPANSQQSGSGTNSNQKAASASAFGFEIVR